LLKRLCFEEERKRGNQACPPFEKMKAKFGALVLQEPFLHVLKDESQSSMQTVIFQLTSTVFQECFNAVLTVRRKSDDSVVQTFPFELDPLDKLRKGLKVERVERVGEVPRFTFASMLSHAADPRLILLQLKTWRNHPVGTDKELYLTLEAWRLDNSLAVSIFTQSFFVLTKKKNHRRIDRESRAPEYYRFMQTIRSKFLEGEKFKLLSSSVTKAIEGFRIDEENEKISIVDEQALNRKKRSFDDAAFLHCDMEPSKKARQGRPRGDSFCADNRREEIRAKFDARPLRRRSVSFSQPAAPVIDDVSFNHGMEIPSSWTSDKFLDLDFNFNNLVHDADLANFLQEVPLF